MPIAASRHPHVEAASTVSTAWAEAPADGAEVAEPYLLTTAVFDDSEPTGPVTSGVHTHTDALLVWPHTGSITLRTRNTVRRLLPGQGAWLPPAPRTRRPTRRAASAATPTWRDGPSRRDGPPPARCA